MVEKDYWTRLRAKRLSRRQLLRASCSGGLGIAVAAMVGCGDAEPPRPAATATATATATGASSMATGTPAAAEQPQRGGTVNYYQTSDPPGFDPYFDFSIAQYHLSYQTQNSLFRNRFGPEADPVAYVIEPDLAQSYEQADDLTHIVKIPKGAKFHDGSELTTDDVIASLERMKQGGPTVEKIFLWRPLDTFTAPDDETVVIKLKHPFFLFQYAMSWRPESSIQSARFLDRHGGRSSNEINGLGPFKLESFERNNVYRLVRHTEYFKQGLPYLDRMNYFIIKDSAAADAAFRSKQVDLFQTSYRLAEPIARSLPDVRWAEIPSGSHTSIHMLSDRPPFDDQRARTAISLAIDRAQMVQVLTLGRGTIVGPIPVHLKEWAIPNPETLPNYKRDLERARQLIREAGLEGAQFEIKISSAGAPDFAEQIKEQIAEAGIDLIVRPVEHVEWIAASQNRNFQIIPFGRLPGYDPDEYSYAIYQPGAGRDFHNGKDDQLIDLVNRQRQTLDREERKQLLNQFERRAAELCFVVYAFDSTRVQMWWPYVKNFGPHMSYVDRTGEKLWVDEEMKRRV